MKQTLIALFATLVPLTAQTIDTLGGTATAPLRTNTSKASVIKVDTSVLLLDYAMYLNVPGPETLTWFLFRHHSRTGAATLEWSQQVAVNGTGVGPTWYSTGPIAVPLIEGNHYMIGVGWPGSLTYHYTTSSAPLPISFGSWQRAHTPGFPIGNTYTIASGIDSAVYHQQFTTVPFGGVDIVGASCGASTTLPRLVASGAPTLGATKALDLVDATPNALGVVSLAIGPTLPVPLPMFGCNIWLNLGAPLASTALPLSATGTASLPMTMPANPAYFGILLSAQAGVLGSGVDLTNALDMAVN